MKLKINNVKKKGNNWQFITLLVVIVFSILYGFYYSKKEKQTLNEDTVYTIGVIIKKEHRTSRGYFIHYDYFVDGEKYKGTQKLTIKKELVNVGDKFQVKYAKNDKSYSELIFNKRITNE